MMGKVGRWLLGGAACALSGCYMHHTADEELLGVPDEDAGPLADAGDGGSGAARGDAGSACAGTDIFSQLTCAFLPTDAGSGQPNINDIINAFGGLGALGNLFGGAGGPVDAGRGAGMPNAAQCQNATDAFTQFLCGLQATGGMNQSPRPDAGGAPAENPPPAATDAGAPLEDAAVPADAATSGG